MDWWSGRTTSEFLNPAMSWDFHPSRYRDFTKNYHVLWLKQNFMPDALPNTNTVSTAKSWVFFVRHHATKLDTIKVTSVTIYVHKQTSLFLQTAVQELYHPLPNLWNNFLFEQVHHGKLVIQELSDQSWYRVVTLNNQGN